MFDFKCLLEAIADEFDLPIWCVEPIITSEDQLDHIEFS